MACKKYYCVINNYTVGLRDKEVTTDPQQGTSAANTVRETVEGEGHLNPVGDNSCEERNGATRSPHESGSRESWESVPQLPSKSYRKQYKFTPGQLCELKRTLEETHYPDALQRKELAQRIKVEEHMVKVWFNNQRARLRKRERALMNKDTPISKKQFRLKIINETKIVIVIEDSVSKGQQLSSQ